MRHRHRDVAGEPVNVLVSLAIAVALDGYDVYGVALPLRAGVDLPLFETGPLRHRLRIAGDYGHFSRSFVDLPDLVTGVQLDVGSLRAVWGVYPLETLGLHLDLGTGFAVLYDRLRLELPNRRVTSSETHAGLPLELGAGWTLGEYFDVGMRYTRVILFSGETPTTLGYFELVAGARL